MATGDLKLATIILVICSISSLLVIQTQGDDVCARCKAKIKEVSAGVLEELSNTCKNYLPDETKHKECMADTNNLLDSFDFTDGRACEKAGLCNKRASYINRFGVYSSNKDDCALCDSFRHLVNQFSKRQLNRLTFKRCQSERGLISLAKRFKSRMGSFATQLELLEKRGKITLASRVEASRVKRAVRLDKHLLKRAISDNEDVVDEMEDDEDGDSKNLKINLRNEKEFMALWNKYKPQGESGKIWLKIDDSGVKSKVVQQDTESDKMDIEVISKTVMDILNDIKNQNKRRQMITLLATKGIMTESEKSRFSIHLWNDLKIEKWKKSLHKATSMLEDKKKEQVEEIVAGEESMVFKRWIDPFGFLIILKVAKGSETSGAISIKELNNVIKKVDQKLTSTTTPRPTKKPPVTTNTPTKKLSTSARPTDREPFYTEAPTKRLRTSTVNPTKRPNKPTFNPNTMSTPKTFLRTTKRPSTKPWTTEKPYWEKSVSDPFIIFPAGKYVLSKPVKISLLSDDVMKKYSRRHWLDEME